MIHRISLGPFVPACARPEVYPSVLPLTVWQVAAPKARICPSHLEGSWAEPWHFPASGDRWALAASGTAVAQYGLCDRLRAPDCWEGAHVGWYVAWPSHARLVMAAGKNHGARAHPGSHLLPSHSVGVAGARLDFGAVRDCGLVRPEFWGSRWSLAD